MVAPLTADQVGALADLSHLWPATNFALIGALALRLQLPGFVRQTNDVDVTVALPPDAVRSMLLTIPGWRPNPRLDYEWRTPAETRVHVIPLSQEALSRGELVWPATGRRMSTLGMRLTLSEVSAMELAPGVRVNVAGVPAVTVLKAIAYQDRPLERERDLADVAEIIERYIGDDDDRRWSPDAGGRSHDEVSAFLLGRDIRGIVNDQERSMVLALLDRIEGETDGGRAQAGMLRLAPPSFRDRPDDLLLRVAALRAGVLGS